MGHLRDPVGLVLVGLGAADQQALWWWISGASVLGPEANDLSSSRYRSERTLVFDWAVAVIEDGCADICDRGSDVT